MIFFSGFCLQNEASLFETYLKKSDFTVAGFSLGAIDALEYVLASKHRIDRLQLFSPAFFDDKEEAFKRAQVHYFKKNKVRYIETFLNNASYPSQMDLSVYYHDSSLGDLERLLHYRWKEEALQALQKRAIMIEVYVGERDKIIDSVKTKDFFLPYAQTIMIKEAGHILQRV